MRLIDADALLNGYDVRKVTEYDESGCGMTYKAVSVEAIEQAPSVDAVEVVRCRECIKRDQSFRCIALYYGFNPHDDWFCAEGERDMDEEARE